MLELKIPKLQGYSGGGFIMSKAIEWRGLNPFTIHRRDELYIRTENEFEGASSDLAVIRSHTVLSWEFDISVVSFRDQDYLVRYGPGDFHFKVCNKSDGTVYTGNTPNEVEHYKSLRSDGNGMVRLKINDFGNYSANEVIENGMFELQLNLAMYGPGTTWIRVGNRLVEEIYGPYPWRACFPHRVMPNEVVELEYHNLGLSDPPPRCEFDNFRIYNFKQIHCDFFEYNPPTAATTPKKVEVLRGYGAYQTTTSIATVIETKLRFLSAEAHTDFISNAEKIHVIFDDKGIPYRGVLELGRCKRVGENLYEQEIKFYAPNKLGVGWI